MDLEVARKALTKRSAFSSKKRVAFFVVAGLALVGGFLLRSGQYFSQPEVEQNAPVTVATPPPVAAPPPAVETIATPPAAAPAPAVETAEPVPEAPPASDAAAAPSEPLQQNAVEQPQPAGEAVEHTAQPESPDSGMIMVSRQPVEVLAGPSSSAPTMYGFPAGRPFRVIGREGGFAHIQDLRSNASGWIDEAALAPPPAAPRAPVVSAPSQPASPKPKSTRRDNQVTAAPEAATEPEPAQTRKRPGLFGRGGPLGGLFGN